MNDALLMRGFERVGNLLRDRQCLIERHCPACDPLRQILALDEFHRERAHAVTLFEAVNVRDVRMVERRERLRFAREPREAIGVVGERVRQDFECDVAVELRFEPRWPTINSQLTTSIRRRNVWPLG